MCSHGAQFTELPAHLMHLLGAPQCLVRPSGESIEIYFLCRDRSAEVSPQAPLNSKQYFVT